MQEKNKKLFGVWMDTQNASIVGFESPESEKLTQIGHVHNEGREPNSNEHSANNEEITHTTKYFKKIAALMPNIDEIHVTGTGQIQEQFIKFLANTPQYKNVVSTESTANKMSDENLVLYISKHFKLS